MCLGGDEDDDDGGMMARKKLKPFEITQEERIKTMTAGENEGKIDSIEITVINSRRDQETAEGDRRYDTRW